MSNERKNYFKARNTSTHTRSTEQAEIIATEIATKSQAILIMSPELDWLREVMQEHTVVISSFDLHSQAIKIALGL